ncbi:hypothetical protein [Paenirhodobacter enshiensis]|uniref:hypothetical protein n=1 Tax=Paenirhodobacter enshiensis TaxID=1105367 RepID=UPI001377A571|nr:hypothetical protein [Paenirhodobacter enshiensis]
MRVKEAVLTFVAMGGFAVPVAFQTSAASGATAASDDRTAAAAPLTVKPEAKKEA